MTTHDRRSVCLALRRAAIRRHDVALLEAAEWPSARHFDAKCNARSRRGATLTELLACVGIVAVLVACALWYGAETIARVRTAIGAD